MNLLLFPKESSNWLRIINEAIISLQLDKMLIVPTKHNPWKEDSVANNQQRIEMIQIALKDNSKCEDGSTKLYAASYIFNEDDRVLNNIETEEEWKMIEAILSYLTRKN